MLLSTLSGFVMMGVIFVPQFSENALRLSTGSGGYMVIILGLFAGVGAPVSGKLIDKFGPKIILAFGFLCSMLSACFMIFVTMRYPSMLTVVIGLALAGLGMGFTMGTPVNYMMLANTDPKQSNSALATLSLVRSVGTAIAPAIMVGFLANAGTMAQADVMALLPKEVKMPALPYAQEVSDELSTLKENPQMKEQLAGIDLSALTEQKTIPITMEGNSNYEISPELLALLQSSDVTTITVNTKTMAQSMFTQMEPQLITKIQGGIDQGIQGIATGKKQMQAAKEKMGKAPAAMAMEKSIEQMDTLSTQMEAMKQAVPGAFDTALSDYQTAIDAKSAQIEQAFQDAVNGGFRNIYRTTIIAAAIAVLIVLLYDPKRERAEE